MFSEIYLSTERITRSAHLDRDVNSEDTDVTELATCQCRCHNTGRNFLSFNFFYFQLATSFHSDRGNIISLCRRGRTPRTGSVWRRGQSARRSWLTSPPCMAAIEWGPAAADARDDWVKLGSCPSLLLI